MCAKYFLKIMDALLSNVKLPKSFYNTPDGASIAGAKQI